METYRRGLLTFFATGVATENISSVHLGDKQLNKAVKLFYMDMHSGRFQGDKWKDLF